MSEAVPSRAMAMDSREQDNDLLDERLGRAFMARQSRPEFQPPAGRARRLIGQISDALHRAAAAPILDQKLSQRPAGSP